MLVFRLMWYTWCGLRQQRAAEQAAKTGKPVDCLGMRFYPPGSDGIPVVGKTP